MKLRGHIWQGQVVLDQPADLPDHTPVIVTVDATACAEGQMSPEALERALAAMASLAPFALAPEVAAELQAWDQKFAPNMAGNMDHGITPPTNRHS